MKYETTKTYPQSYYVRGMVVRWVTCSHCNQTAHVDQRGRLAPHEVLFPCEGGGRFYWNMYGERVTELSP